MSEVGSHEEFKELTDNNLEISVNTITDHFDSRSDEKREQRRKMTKIIHDRYMKQTLQEVDSEDSFLNNGDIEQMSDQEDAEAFSTPLKNKFEYSGKRKQQTDTKKKFGIKYSKMKTIHD